MKRIKYFLLLVFILAPMKVFAVVTSYSDTAQNQLGGFGSSNFNNIFLKTANIAGSISLAVAIILLMVGFTLKSTASGNVAEINKSKGYLKNGFIVLSISLLALAIDLYIA